MAGGENEGHRDVKTEHEAEVDAVVVQGAFVWEKVIESLVGQITPKVIQTICLNLLVTFRHIWCRMGSSCISACYMPS